MGGRTLYRTQSPKRTLFHTGIDMIPLVNGASKEMNEPHISCVIVRP
jgi:hypothetical protein